MFKMEGYLIPKSPLEEQSKMAVQPILDCDRSENVKPLSFQGWLLQHYPVYPN